MVELHTLVLLQVMNLRFPSYHVLPNFHNLKSKYSLQMYSKSVVTHEEHAWDKRYYLSIYLTG